MCPGAQGARGISALLRACKPAGQVALQTSWLGCTANQLVRFFKNTNVHRYGGCNHLTQGGLRAFASCKLHSHAFFTKRLCCWTAKPSLRRDGPISTKLEHDAPRYRYCMISYGIHWLPKWAKCRCATVGPRVQNVNFKFHCQLCSHCRVLNGSTVDLSG